MTYILNLIDLATTMYITAQGGMELNPVADLLILAGLFPAEKLILGTVCIAWLEHYSKHHLAARIGKWVVTAYYAILCINNLAAIGVLPWKW